MIVALRAAAAAGDGKKGRANASASTIRADTRSISSRIWRSRRVDDRQPAPAEQRDRRELHARFRFAPEQMQNHGDRCCHRREKKQRRQKRGHHLRGS